MGESLGLAQYTQSYEESIQIEERKSDMLWTIIIILLVLWLLGAFGSRLYSNFPKPGNWIHTLLVIVLILVVLNLLGVI